MTVFCHHSFLIGYEQGILGGMDYGQIAGASRRYSQGNAQGTAAHRTDGGNR
ncbi:hypothetical protein IQE94_14705 [Synechocystis sp. PCC 7339]|uniref:hypothetical protein n=1 Tax=unclassified Synechocystis TaxID=2640012 RepID=UPI001BB022EC|nr:MULTISPECIES: hypothetical protein [unclassified Synechocystis]QUS60244.1 hypothetical protein HTZ78_05855 [Synechocystis sp. PCC 7338]UAJ72311.1 hypothetical protein IQE94_14705 [Synechocystis sp. PCC 7339]